MQSEKKDFTYKLNASQYDQALTILRKEHKVNMPSRRQKIMFSILKIAVYGFVVTSIILIILSIMDEKKLYSLEGPVISVIFIIAIIAEIVFFLMMPILFLLNLPLLIKLRRQNKLVRRLGLSKALKAPWRAQLKRKKFTKITTLIIGIIGLLIILFGLAGGSGLLSNEYGNKEDLIYGGIIVIIGLIIMLTQFMRRGKERLEVVARLKSSLSSYKDASEKSEDERINIPMEDYNTIAKIERDQISRERRECIISSFYEENESLTYTVKKSRNVLNSQSQLDQATKFNVREMIDDLMVEPRPAGFSEDPKTGIVYLRVPETSVELGYIVDDSNRSIKIISLQ